MIPDAIIPAYSPLQSAELGYADEHLTNYYQLSDEGRNDVDQYIKAQLSIKRDPDRAADIKKITKW